MEHGSASPKPTTTTTTTTLTAPTAGAGPLPAGKYVVAVGPSKCGKSTLLRDLLGAKALKHAITLRAHGEEPCHFFGVEQMNRMMKDKKCTALVIETPLADSDTRDAVSQLVRTHRHTEKSIYHAIEGVFEVPRRLRKHADVVAVFKMSDESDRHRVYRHFLQSFYDDFAQFEAALDTLAEYECLLLEKGDKPPRVYKADLAAAQHANSSSSSSSSWLWRWFGY